MASDHQRGGPEDIQVVDELIAQFPGHHQFLTAAKVWMEVAATMICPGFAPVSGYG